MGKTAQCPSCGAAVEFRSVVSVLAVCDYCRSTLLRRGAELENLGRMAELIEDRSPLQRGAEGRWNGLHFGVVGRIQLRYAQGLWNEWHLLFDDGRSGWLSEAGGEYVISLPQPVGEALPAFDRISVGQLVSLNGRTYTATNKLAAECVAGEGELPFRVGAGYAAPVVDLRDEQGGEGGFATLDYSDADNEGGKPLVFIGTSVPFASLHWANLREPPQQPAFKARAFNCPNCGAPLKVAHADIVTVGCTGCGAVLDTASAEVKLIERVAAELRWPLLPLGSKGTLRGEALEVIGAMRRCMKADGIEYCWGEYVCLGRDVALVWLTEYNGHWNVARVLARSVAVRADRAILGKETFRHFQDYEARVAVVLGEFPWRVRADDRARLSDYVAPPLLLSREATDEEVTWTLAEYLPAEEITAAFALEQPLPAARGVHANQPNPHEERHRRVCRRFWQFFFLGLLLYFVMLFIRPGAELVRQELVFEADDDEPRLSREFRLAAPAGRLEVSNETDLRNNWLALGLTLVNKDTGEAWQAQRELGYYEGVEEGESWSEGTRSAAVVFVDLPAGSYVLSVEAEVGTTVPGQPFAGLMMPDFSSPQSLAAGKMVPITGQPAPPVAPVRSQLTISQPGPRISSFLVLTLFLVLFPIYTRIRRGSFEVARWAESDHPIVTTTEDD